MAVAASKRSIMTLYCGGHDLYSHQVRIVLAEKGVVFDVVDVTAEHEQKERIDTQYYKTLPTLVDRDLVLTDPRVMLEYLDERFPHPPLLPVYPVARAKTRLMMLHIEREWYSLIHKIHSQTADVIKSVRQQIKQQLINMDPLFRHNNYCFSEDFTLVDCCMAPLLWSLQKIDLEFPAQAAAIKAYADRVFKRPSFKASLVEHERSGVKR